MVDDLRRSGLLEFLSLNITTVHLADVADLYLHAFMEDETLKTKVNDTEEKKVSYSEDAADESDDEVNMNVENLKDDAAEEASRDAGELGLEFVAYIPRSSSSEDPHTIPHLVIPNVPDVQAQQMGLDVHEHIRMAVKYILKTMET
ncbi:hypothetical protein Dimus_010585 [Dionaea muscipula]